MSHKEKTEKKYASPPVTMENWEQEKMRRLGARRTSVILTIRALTESLDESVFEGWKFWDEIYKKYRLDPNKEYYELHGILYERVPVWKRDKK